MNIEITVLRNLPPAILSPEGQELHNRLHDKGYAVQKCSPTWEGCRVTRHDDPTTLAYLYSRPGSFSHREILPILDDLYDQAVSDNMSRCGSKYPEHGTLNLNLLLTYFSCCVSRAV